jgi:branched-subunit amino acid ABC-type transport system permease component
MPDARPMRDRCLFAAAFGGSGKIAGATIAELLSGTIWLRASSRALRNFWQKSVYQFGPLPVFVTKPEGVSPFENKERNGG